MEYLTRDKFSLFISVLLHSIQSCSLLFRLGLPNRIAAQSNVKCFFFLKNILKLYKKNSKKMCSISVYYMYENFVQLF